MECESDCKGVLFRCGPHPIDEAKIIYIKESETGITIGRGEDKPGFQCLLSTYVSRLHLKIWSVGGIWYIQDLNSFNGTYVYNMVFNNGSTLKLRPHETYTLLPNSAIGFGMCPIVWLSKHTYIFDPDYFVYEFRTGFDEMDVSGLCTSVANIDLEKNERME